MLEEEPMLVALGMIWNLVVVLVGLVTIDLLVVTAGGPVALIGLGMKGIAGCGCWWSCGLDKAGYSMGCLWL